MHLTWPIQRSSIITNQMELLLKSTLWLLKLRLLLATTESIDIIPYEQWSHVSSKDKPAESGSRRVNPEDLANSSLWWHRLSFLIMNKNHWPKQIEFSVDEKALSKQRAKPKSHLMPQLLLQNMYLMLYLKMPLLYLKL
ncbi:hypothetical protein NPIL_17181 [Nephila pilipes]|uniref:Uncharacterized protein n=1 Tax=Nephila pilipes TaxID=299642 RepID=A0A8X6QTK3_NEPPI|nr:hypothetical protein NPIL_17181 [Nephila pilipes]